VVFFFCHCLSVQIDRSCIYLDLLTICNKILLHNTAVLY